MRYIYNFHLERGPIPRFDFLGQFMPRTIQLVAKVLDMTTSEIGLGDDHDLVLLETIRRRSVARKKRLCEKSAPVHNEEVDFIGKCKKFKRHSICTVRTVRSVPVGSFNIRQPVPEPLHNHR